MHTFNLGDTVSFSPRHPMFSSSSICPWEVVDVREDSYGILYTVKSQNEGEPLHEVFPSELEPYPTANGIVIGEYVTLENTFPMFPLTGWYVRAILPGGWLRLWNELDPRKEMTVHPNEITVTGQPWRQIDMDTVKPGMILCIASEFHGSMVIGPVQKVTDHGRFVVVIQTHVNPDRPNQELQTTIYRDSIPTDVRLYVVSFRPIVFGRIEFERE